MQLALQGMLQLVTQLTGCQERLQVIVRGLSYEQHSKHCCYQSAQLLKCMLLLMLAVAFAHATWVPVGDNSAKQQAHVSLMNLVRTACRT